MKKTYITPTSMAVKLDIKSSILTISLQRGDDMTEGSADAREMELDDWDE